MILLQLTAFLVLAVAHADPFSRRQSVAFSKLQAKNGIEGRRSNHLQSKSLLTDGVLRGGGSVEVAVDSDDELEEESLATTTMTKIERAKLSSVKKEVASKLAKAAKKKRRSIYVTIVPYIVRATINPFTFFAMVKAYWISLFDFDFLKKKEVPGQDLRSALEEKAKRSPYSGPGKGKRKMKPGQAKTLSDLPQLSS